MTEEYVSVGANLASKVERLYVMLTPLCCIWRICRWTPGSSVLLENTIFAKLLEKSLPFTERVDSSPYWEQPASRPYSEPVRPVPTPI